ncbi:hypothetical protein AgCh_016210 [Apium graveolens]
MGPLTSEYIIDSHDRTISLLTESSNLIPCRGKSNRSLENQTVNDPMNVMADPNAQITGSDGVHQQPINPNARIVRSDGGQTPVGHVPSGHVHVGHTVIGQFSVPLGQISAGFTPLIIPAVHTGVHTPVV